MVTSAPTGTVTFLFTDLEGSTRLWEDHPDAMQEALKRHDELLQHAVEANRGYVVKTTGDGIHAAFATADDAVAAAIAGQGALVEETWGSTGPLRVRMGVHTGRRSCATATTTAPRSTAPPASWPRPTAARSCSRTRPRSWCGTGSPPPSSWRISATTG